MKNMTLKIILWFIRRASAIHLWLLVRWARNLGWDASDAWRIAKRELAAVPDSMNGHFAWLVSEREIITARLVRRFDIGLAMNEATNRALEERARLIAEEGISPEPTPILSETQRAALKFQEEYLQIIARRP